MFRRYGFLAFSYMSISLVLQASEQPTDVIINKTNLQSLLQIRRNKVEFDISFPDQLKYISENQELEIPIPRLPSDMQQAISVSKKEFDSFDTPMKHISETQTVNDQMSPDLKAKIPLQNKFYENCKQLFNALASIQFKQLKMPSMELGDLEIKGFQITYISPITILDAKKYIFEELYKRGARFFNVSITNEERTPKNDDDLFLHDLTKENIFINSSLLSIPSYKSGYIHFIFKNPPLLSVNKKQVLLVNLIIAKQDPSIFSISYRDEYDNKYNKILVKQDNPNFVDFNTQFYSVVNDVKEKDIDYKTMQSTDAQILEYTQITYNFFESALALWAAQKNKSILLEGKELQYHDQYKLWVNIVNIKKSTQQKKQSASKSTAGARRPSSNQTSWFSFKWRLPNFQQIKNWFGALFVTGLGALAAISFWHKSKSTPDAIQATLLKKVSGVTSQQTPVPGAPQK